MMSDLLVRLRQLQKQIRKRAITKNEFLLLFGELAVKERLEQGQCDDYTLECYRHNAERDGDLIYQTIEKMGLSLLKEKSILDFLDGVVADAEKATKIENVVPIADVLEGKPCKGKIVDMGFWFDVPHITTKTLKVLREGGVAGVRLVVDVGMIDKILSFEKWQKQLQDLQKKIELHHSHYTLKKELEKILDLGVVGEDAEK